MSKDELSFLDDSILQESKDAAFLSDLSFLEDNSDEFLNYKTYESSLPDPKTSAKSNKSTAKITAVLGLLATAIAIYFLVFGKTSHSTLNYQIAFLPDGSEIRLEPGAELKYSNHQFSENRTINLKGNAFFDVAHKEDAPFKIVFGENTITVLGTSFYVFQEDNIVKVRDGRVKVDNGEESKILYGGEAVTLENNKITSIQFIDSPTKLFSGEYSNTPLKTILEDLEDAFDLEIVSKMYIENCKYNGTFKESTLKEALDELSLIFNLSFNYENYTLYINSLDCN